MVEGHFKLNNTIEIESDSEIEALLYYLDLDSNLNLNFKKLQSLFRLKRYINHSKKNVKNSENLRIQS